MPPQKYKSKARSIYAERDVIVGDQVSYGYQPEQVQQLIDQIRVGFQAKSFDGECPYVGLSAFEEEDADRFFGRERTTQELVERIKTFHAAFIVGPSGSGKSSLVRAGLIPHLKRGALPGSKHWLYISLSPGRSPITQLGYALDRAARLPRHGAYLTKFASKGSSAFEKPLKTILSEGKNRRAILFIDQFEELFTQTDEEERNIFLNLIMGAINNDEENLILIIAMRSDFVPQCASYPPLNTFLNNQFFQVGSMQPDELVQAIALPSISVGLKIEPELVSQIINDMGKEPGALPLMQFALKDLFEHNQRYGGVVSLTREDYLQRGGIHKALERHANSEFGRLNKREKVLAENLFQGLVEIGRNTQDTRRIARFEEFIDSGANSNGLESVVRKLTDARLIIADENEALERTITLAHEKLIEAWPWLNQLVNKNREFIQFQNQIIEDAMEWETHNKNRSYLYTGARLTTVQKKIHEFQIENEKARTFINASQAANRRTWLQRSMVASLLLVMSAVIYFVIINPLFTTEMKLTPVDDFGGAGVNALQILPDGTIYAGMYNMKIKGGAPCLAIFGANQLKWKELGPNCKTLVVALWVDPVNQDRIFFSESNEKGLYRTQDGGQKWEKVADGIPMKNVSSLTGSTDGLLFAGDLETPIGVYKSADQGKSWTPLEGSPQQTIFTLAWVPKAGLLVGGNGGLWLWNQNGKWEQLIALDISQKDRRILSVTTVSTEPLTILAGGDEGIYLWKKGGAIQHFPQNEKIKKAWSMVVVAKPEPHILALTFPNSKIWQMTLEGENEHELKNVGSDGFPLIVQNEDPLRLWVGTLDGLYIGELRTRISEFFNTK